ncbi:positive regulator of sigma(E), RseC/MucC [Clostridium acetireducens DSM 10703]|jgi:sigma-E factor negative regulatory protein RseC|uniref:Positive regulator of sigma(E), RseC/MucC n=1 Tax=Clostridium acetireducens DSM 10703 TaxID=1121290 RepID=A0A1E8F1A4_9CLOT|nr:SoxR reducing system RseC family protein [Clostridium acetireducens]OFI07253.1 positive regulator of sigma(E), RseC/MucC [Clostridium acetireducens DSM 10703]
MEEYGYVKDVKDGLAVVQFKRKSGCGDNCAHCSAQCDAPPLTVDIRNTLNAEKGDKVKIEMDGNKFIKLSAITYGIPFVFLIVGIVIGLNLFKHMGYKNYELLGSLVGFVFLAISYSILSIIDKKLKPTDNETLSMTEVIRLNR